MIDMEYNKRIDLNNEMSKNKSSIMLNKFFNGFRIPVF